MSTRKTTSTSSKKVVRPKAGKSNQPARSAEGGSRKRKAASAGAAAPTAEDPEVWTLRLYVTGRGERSERALSNLRRLCESNLSTVKYKIEVIDLLKNPELARDDQILAIPTLVRKLPEPMKRIIGDLSNVDRAMLSLDFPSSKDDLARP